jgi:hypothetical protein
MESIDCEFKLGTKVSIKSRNGALVNIGDLGTIKDIKENRMGETMYEVLMDDCGPDEIWDFYGYNLELCKSMAYAYMEEPLLRFLCTPGYVTMLYDPISDSIFEIDISEARFEMLQAFNRVDTKLVVLGAL